MVSIKRDAEFCGGMGIQCFTCSRGVYDDFVVYLSGHQGKDGHLSSSHDDDLLNYRW